MFIRKKVEEIKKDSEQVRLRWAWGMTFLTMIFIVFIWFFSLKNQTSPQRTSADVGGGEIFNQIGQEARSIKEVTDDFRQSFEEQGEKKPNQPQDESLSEKKAEEIESGEGFPRE